jgi:predicted O-methyltransferase YrrM/predicted GH43/DUF377 family glycosyl hydrolase
MHNHPGTCFPGSKDCELEETSKPHRDYWAAAAAGRILADANGTAFALPCVFRGKQIPTKEAPDTAKTWYECENGYGIVCPCRQCNSSCAGYAIADVYRSFDSKNLFPEAPGTRFNPSIVRWQGTNLIAFRNRSYASQIWIGRMSDDWRPIGLAHILQLDHPRCRDGQDDPRFFVFEGKLHVSFTGVERTAIRTRTHVLYCQLDDKLQVADLRFCDYADRNDLEKNWVFFQHGGSLFASYSLAPHRVLSIDGERCRTEYVTDTRATWHGGEMRGGASPVLVDGVWHSFFHSSQVVAGEVEYWTGCALFRDSPPFRIEAVTDRPILRPDRRGSSASGKHVRFTCGSHYHDRIDEAWFLSSGIDDRFCEIARVDATDLAAFFRVTDRPADPDPFRDKEFLERADVASCLEIDGWCTGEKAAWLGSAIRTLDARHVVELGVWRGRSLLAMALAMRRHSSESGRPGHVLGIDSYSCVHQTAGITDQVHLAWSEKVDWDSEWLRACLTLRDHVPEVASLVRSSSSAAALWVRPGIDLIHIDACHGEDQSRLDVKEWLPLVRRGGIVVLDDTDWPTVQGALQDLRHSAERIHDGGTWQAFRKI